MSLLFGGFGVAMPYVPRWLEEARGLNGVEIALVISSAQMARVVIGPIIATWADGFGDRSMPVRLLATAALLFQAGFFLSDGLLQLAILSFAATTAAQAIVPLVEGAALRASLRADGLPYGACRAMGSAVFVAGTIMGGFLVGAIGVAAAPIMLLTTLSLTAASAWFGLKPDINPTRATTLGFGARLRLGLSLLRRPPFALAVGAAAVIQASHAFYYSFCSIVWRDQGVADGVIGLLISFGVVVEIALLWMLPRVERRFQPEVLIAMGAAAALLRWAVLAFEPGFALLWPMQALHALTFAATHVGALRLIQREAPEEVAGLAQTLYAALASGLFMGLSTLLSGVLHDAYGALGYLAMSALGGIGLAMIAPLANQRR